MSNIEFSQEEKQILVGKIQSYFHAELSEEIGQFDSSDNGFKVHLSL